jgi:hypothetical protein
MRYILFNSLLIFLLASFTTACSSKVAIPSNTANGNILVETSACGVSLEKAKAKSIVKLSEMLMCIVKSNQTSNDKYSSKEYNHNHHTLIEKNSSFKINIQSSFMSITPKFIKSYKKSALFKDDQYCTTTIIDYELFNKYNNLALEDFNKVKKNIQYYNGKVFLKDKEKVIKKVLSESEDDIDEYHKLYSVIRLLPAKSKLKTDITLSTMMQYLDVKPFITLVDETPNHNYNQEHIFKINIEDENIDSVDYKIIFDNKYIFHNQNMIKINFHYPQKVIVFMEIKDENGYKYKKSLLLSIKNKKPISSFSTSKFKYTDFEPIKIKSQAYDIEQKLKSVKYRVYSLNKKGKKHLYIKNFKPSSRIRINGTYIIEQIVKDRYNSVSKSQQKIRIYNQPPVADFKLNKYIYNIGEPIDIQSKAYDYERRLKKISYKLYNLNNNNRYSISNHQRMFHVGRYLIIQNVLDSYGYNVEKRKYLAVEDKRLQHISRNDSEWSLKRVMGKPYKRARTTFYSWNDYYLMYKDYVFIFDNNSLDCAVYKVDFMHGKECDDYRRHHYKFPILN